jgi:RNA polymerase sigma-70 factor (ECF subfamily)
VSGSDAQQLLRQFPEYLRVRRTGHNRFDFLTQHLSLMVARSELRTPLQAKVDAADLVQETFIEATRDFAAFRGQTEPQLLAWLRGILRHNLTDVTRRFEMSCRCLSHEVSLGDPPGAEPTCGGARTVCELLIAREQRRALDAALERLPPAYRQVLHLRYGERWSYAQIGTS